MKEWVDNFQAHRIQGDVMFSLTEPTLKEMGVNRIGDRLYIVDCLQSLYEQLTSWAKKQESAQHLALGSGSTSSTSSGYGGGSVHSGYGGGASAGYASVGARGSAAGSSSGAGGGTANQVIQQLVAQGFSVEEVLALLESRPDLAAQLTGQARY